MRVRTPCTGAEHEKRLHLGGARIRGGPAGVRRVAFGNALRPRGCAAPPGSAHWALPPFRVRTPCTRAEHEKRLHLGGASLRGGPAGVRTLDLGIKSPLLYQLSYRSVFCFARTKRWGGRRDSNPRPPGPQPSALPTELRPPFGHLVTRLDNNDSNTTGMQEGISKTCEIHEDACTTLGVGCHGIRPKGQS